MNLRRLTHFAALTVSSTVVAEVEQEIPWGVEAVTGYRSEYVQRGFKWANGVVDFQVEAEYAINDDWFTSLGAWYGTATGSSDFQEAAGYANIRWNMDSRFTLGFEATWRSVDHPLYDDGLDLSPTLSWHLNNDFDIAGGLAWDTGADGLYMFVEARWSKAVTTSGFVGAETGLSWVSDYYKRSGINDAYARLTYTQVLNHSVSLTPFIGTSVPLQSNRETVRLFGGLWFEVNF